MVSEFGTPRLRAGDEITVTIGTSDYPALVTEVRGDRIFVKINPLSDAPIETFYHWEELFGPREKPMAGKFELYKDRAGQYRFRLKAGNGEVIATSEAYATKSAAKNGIAAVLRSTTDARVVDQTE